ncbi:hypothetical protein [Actinoplanes aureus]|uniref:Uncharacterized protein n=1 Tax=Actinoplanes aureus TaxID=2792083 RepID=A0A931CAF0_9ACTN|nr:hypothetical protein [Actinoplanes aureus]MBG0562503.1 hypothetical protein [Actinoplanes aureus]
MTLHFCTDPAPADWIADSELPWEDLVTLGPGGFDAYARLRLLPDPVRPGMSENDAEAEDWRSEQLPRLFELLAAETTTPGDCYFCVWDGFGQSDVVSDEWRPDPWYDRKVQLPARAYWLFRGPLAEVGTWDSAAGWPGEVRLDDAEPAFVWPADRAWCFAFDVDPHWAGIGGDPGLIARLAADPRLDVVPTDRSADRPFYS